MRLPGAGLHDIFYVGITMCSLSYSTPSFICHCFSELIVCLQAYGENVQSNILFTLTHPKGVIALASAMGANLTIPSYCCTPL